MLESSLSRLKLSAMLAGLLLATGLSAVARSEEPKLSISGYDPVAYFTDGKPVQGRAEIEYLWHNQYWLGIWREHSEEYIKRANASWQALADRAEPAIVGPPCPASPPTTKVALRDSGHWVVVGGQVARDEAGNVVGKGNLQQQIEQVGKNVGACLEAGGATVKDIVFTVSYVKQPAEFDKYADLRQRYFGPPTPDSTIVAMPPSADPDLLVQVEAFAKTP